MTINEAIALLTANGYRVVKPKPKRGDRNLGLNAVGKPYSPQYSPQYDPNYKMKYRAARSTAHLRLPYGKDMRFVGDEQTKSPEEQT
jgi:hypothetical protein